MLKYLLNSMRGKIQSSSSAAVVALLIAAGVHVVACADSAARYALDDALALDGMRGFPKAAADAEKVLPAQTFLPFVDAYGQFLHDDWPGKVHSDADLAEQRRQEEAQLAAHPHGPVREADVYGGWAGGPQLAATGRFRTEKVDGKWWFVDPEGHLFFSLGVNAVRPDSPTGTSGREPYFSWLPAKGDPDFGRFCGKQWSPAANGFYKDAAHVPFATFDFARANAFRKYGEDWQVGFAARSLARLHAWGLNTVTSWSDASVQRSGKIPYTVKLSTKGPVIEGSGGWWGKLRDPFADEFAENLRQTVADEAARSGGDPWCIGWFVDNELSWGDDDLEIGRAVLRSPATQPAKIAAVKLFERKCGSIDALNRAWGADYGSWDDLLAASVTNAPDKFLAFVHRLVVARYYRSVREAVKAAAPEILYLGSRIAKGKKTVYEECARYCDVVSVNHYGQTPTRDLPEGAVDRPMLVSEFHIGATDRGMFHPGLVAARDQTERADGYRAYVNACLDHPRYVGAHWFQWQDQPLTGRLDGENYAIGLVSITDAPHKELVSAVRKTAAGMYQRRSSAEFNVTNRRKEEQ